ncbi:MAG TPA: TIGR03619 family F420-dependent LLM class oxidoreductase [Streptosporangiaceae bacterium]
MSGAWATPRDLASLGTQAEEAGYASLWTFQRLLVPESTPMEPVYASVLDPLVSLGFLAAGTAQIRLGVALVNLPFVSPGHLAKQATTVDVLSGGRLDLGLGIGWLPEEFELAGASMARRGARAGEYVAALHALWNPGPDGLSRFAGEFYSVPPGQQQPTPVQQPGPPIILGGMSRPAMERAGRIADGWMSSSRADLTRIADDIKIVRGAAAAAGRDPDRVRIVCRGVVRAGEEARNKHGERQLLSGSYNQIRADTEWLAERGVIELFYDLNWDPLIGSPDVDHAAAVGRAGEIMAALAPAR